MPTLVFESGRPARVDHYDENAGPAAAAAVAAGVRDVGRCTDPCRGPALGHHERVLEG